MKQYNWYIIECQEDGKQYVAQYYGREEGFECCVCNKGHNAYCFNLYYDEDMYQTWCYGKEHMPKIIKDLGKHEKQIMDDEVGKYLKESE